MINKVIIFLFAIVLSSFSRWGPGGVKVEEVILPDYNNGKDMPIVREVDKFSYDFEKKEEFFELIIIGEMGLLGRQLEILVDSTAVGFVEARVISHLLLPTGLKHILLKHKKTNYTSGKGNFQKGDKVYLKANIVMVFGVMVAVGPTDPTEITNIKKTAQYIDRYYIYSSKNTILRKELFDAEIEEAEEDGYETEIVITK